MSNCHEPPPATYHPPVTVTMPGMQVTGPASPWCHAGFAGAGTVGHQTPASACRVLDPSKPGSAGVGSLEPSQAGSQLPKEAPWGPAGSINT